MVHDDTYMAVPTVSPVDSATPYKAFVKHEFNAKDSHLHLPRSRRFGVMGW